MIVGYIKYYWCRYLCMQSSIVLLYHHNLFYFNHAYVNLESWALSWSFWRKFLRKWSSACCRSPSLGYKPVNWREEAWPELKSCWFLGRTGQKAWKCGHTKQSLVHSVKAKQTTESAVHLGTTRYSKCTKYTKVYKYTSTKYTSLPTRMALFIIETCMHSLYVYVGQVWWKSENCFSVRIHLSRQWAAPEKWILSEAESLR